jgi:hypothetical protein
VQVPQTPNHEIGQEDRWQIGRVHELGLATQDGQLRRADPMAYATISRMNVWPGTSSPVWSRYLARVAPILLGGRNDAPPPTSCSMGEWAWSNNPIPPAITRSQQRISSRPPARAKPVTAASAGFGQASQARKAAPVRPIRSPNRVPMSSLSWLATRERHPAAARLIVQPPQVDPDAG